MSYFESKVFKADFTARDVKNFGASETERAHQKASRVLLCFKELPGQS